MIRRIEERDARAFIELCRQLDTETRFLLFEPGEQLLTQEQHIGRIQQDGQQIVLVAEDEGQLVGFVGATVGSFRRNRHAANLVMGVLASCWGRGIGARLLDALEGVARERGLHRLELAVMARNQRAIALYHRCGFVIEGRRCHSVLVDGEYVDEYWMGKLLL